MLIAALAAEGTSEIGNVIQIDRGYERIDLRLRELGARIERVARRACPRVAPGDSPRVRVASTDDPPDTPRDPGRPARRDAGASAHSRARSRTSSSGSGTARSPRPTIEYHEVLARGDERGAPAAYRFFDEDGALLAMRTDMTIPIARLVATRLARRRAAVPALLLRATPTAPSAPSAGRCASSSQAGVELVGAEAPEGTAEVIEVLAAALDAVGLTRAVIGLGDADLYRQLLAELEVAERAPRVDPRAPRRARPGRPRGRGRRSWSSMPARRETLLRLPEPARRPRGPGRRPAARRRRRRARDRAARGDLRRALDAAGSADRVQPRPRAASRPRLLHGRDPRGLRPGARPRPRRRRALRRADGPLRAPASRRPGFALYLERVHIAQAEEERLDERPGPVRKARRREARRGLRVPRPGRRAA